MGTSTKGRMKTVEDILEHHGVKGQKWGIRTRRASTSKSGGASSKPKAHELSDEDLKKAVSRMQMEKQYKQLLGHTSNNNVAKKIAAGGAAFVGGLALSITRETIKNQASNKISKELAKKAAKKAAS